jgi:two-component system chemotaxis sensor kinase CheA
MVRNSVDHGLSCRTSASRTASRRSGLSASRAPPQRPLLISVSDDGRGVDFDRLRDRIAERKLAGADTLAACRNRSCLEFLFAGLSTAASVTDISAAASGSTSSRMRHAVRRWEAPVRPRSSSSGEGLTIQLDCR